MPQTFQFTVELTDQGIRLDKFLAGKMPDYSRAVLQKATKYRFYTLDNHFTMQ